MTTGKRGYLVFGFPALALVGVLIGVLLADRRQGVRAGPTARG